MVKLKYNGKMAFGFVEGVGYVEKGKEYEVSESILLRLAGGEWERVNAPPKVEKKKAKFVFEEKNYFNDEIGGKE